MKATLDEMFELGRREGWDEAVDAFTGILDSDILTGAPGDIEQKLVMRRNLQSLRKRNPGRPVTPEDVRKKWDENGLASRVGPPDEPPGPPPPQPVPYTSEPGGSETERVRLAAIAAVAEERRAVDAMIGAKRNGAAKKRKNVHGPF